MGKHSKNKNQKLNQRRIKSAPADTHSSWSMTDKDLKTQKQMTKITGGVEQKNPSITSFHAVLDMIRTEGATLTILSYSSLKGFIFRLDIPPTPENTQFFTLNSDKTAFTKPVVSLILKIEILSENVEKLEPLVIERVSYTKETDKATNFYNEAKTQQDIYINTVWPNGLPITLSVADYSYFDIDHSYTLLDELYKIASNNISQFVLVYLKKELTSNIGMANYGQTVYPRNLGMVAMELANTGFIELHKIEISNAYKLNCLYALAENIVLFVKLKKINYDCHLGNVMANPIDTNPDTLDRAHLIDFGRVIDILTINIGRAFRTIYNRVSINTNDHTKRQYINDRDVATSFQFAQLYNTDTIYPDSDIPKNIVYLVIIIKFISHVDYIYNSLNFRFEKHDKPQMSKFLHVLYDGDSEFSKKWTNQKKEYNIDTVGNNAPMIWFPEPGTVPFQNYQIIANYIEKITRTEKIHKEIIDAMVGDGRIVVFDKDSSAYERRDEFNRMEIGGGCRRKPRISRKYRKTYKKIYKK